MIYFLHLTPTSSHLYSLEVENCDSNSRLVVNEDDNGKFRLERAKALGLLFKINFISFRMCPATATHKFRWVTICISWCSNTNFSPNNIDFIGLKNGIKTKVMLILLRVKLLNMNIQIKLDHFHWMWSAIATYNISLYHHEPYKPEQRWR